MKFCQVAMRANLNTHIDVFTVVAVGEES